MQYIPIEFVLESSAIFAGVIFALVALFGIYYYSTDIQYRRWALTHLSFWVAFLPPNIFAGLPYAGEFVSTILRIYACILLLRAFNFRRLSKVPNRIMHTATFIAISLFWIPVTYFLLPPNLSAIPTSLLMTLTFFYVSYEILSSKRNRGIIWRSAGASYLLWAISSLPMIFLPLYPEVLVAGYVQFIAQAAVMITMFLSFIGSTTKRVEENLRLTNVVASLISHDLRNYLNVAHGAIILAEGKDDESNDMLETSKRALDAATEFMNQVRSIWIDLEAQMDHITDLDICEVISDVIHRSIEEHSLEPDRIRLDCPSKCYVSTTPLVSQVVWNIVDNAVSHSNGVPEILISVQMKDSVEIAFSDRCNGFPPELKKKILSPEQDNNGFGLGLMLVKEITSIYGIQIGIEDRVVDNEVVGSVFTLCLPHSGGVPS